MFVRAGESAIMYDFFLYTGKSSVVKENTSCDKVGYGYANNFPEM